jgi:hypothetical protein
LALFTVLSGIDTKNDWILIFVSKQSVLVGVIVISSGGPGWFDEMDGPHFGHDSAT